MALQISYTDPLTMVPAPVAYARVTKILVDGFAQSVDVQVGLYITAAARQAGGSPFSVLHFSPPFAPLLSGPADIQTAIYNWLKSQPTFTGAADV